MIAERIYAMAKIKIISDSSSDLTPALLEKYEIEIVPFYINLGGTTLVDGVNVDAGGIYKYVADNGILPGTTACAVEDYRRVFEKWRGEGYDIICHTISSEMSGSCQNARIACEGMSGIYVVDSRNLSSGVGHVVIRSAIMARQGMSAPDIVEALGRDIIPKVRSSFILDNLDYMRRGGRCSSVTLLGSNLLRIKPEIVVENGTMRVGRKFRGPLMKVLEEYVDARLEDTAIIRPELIFITHTGNPPEQVEAVRRRIEMHMHFDEIIETRASGTVTSHSGPNTLGILYVEK